MSGAESTWEPDRGDGAPSKGIGLAPNQVFSIDVIARLGMALLREQPLLVLGAGGVVLAMQIGGQAVQQVVGLAVPPSVEGQLAVSVLGLAVGLFVALGTFWITAGLMNQAEVAARGGTPSFGDLFFPERLLKAIGANLVAQIAVSIPMVLLLGPAFAALLWSASRLEAGDGSGTTLVVAGAALLWMCAAILVVTWIGLFSLLVTPAAVLSGGSALEAVAAAWDAASGARITLFAVVLVYGIALGLSCCTVVGVAVVQGVYMSGIGLAWLLYARPREETRRWAFFERHAADLY